MNSDSPLRRAVKEATEKVEQEMIGRVLIYHHWNRKRAALDLGISYRALLYKLQQYQIVPIVEESELKPAVFE